MKKFISVALVASMVASMGVTAFASDYDYKDKQLEFDKALLYDGKGADELWLPILCDGKYIVDDVAESRATATKMSAEAKKLGQKFAEGYHLLGVDIDMNPIDGELQYETDGTIKVDATGAHILTTDGKLDGLYNPDLYTGLTTDAEKIAAVDDYLEANYKPKYEWKEISKQASDGTAFGFEDYRYEVIKTLFGSPNAPIAKLGILAGDYGDIAKAMYKNMDATYAPDLVDIDNIEDVNDVEIEWKAKRGGNLVADVYIDEVEDLGGLYCVVFELTDHLGIAVQYIDGELRMESGKNRELDEQDIRYNYYGKAAYSVTEYQFTVGDLENGYEVDGYDNYINLVDFNEEYHYVFFKKNVEWVEIEDNQGFYYEVDVAEQGKINLVYNNKSIPAVVDAASDDAVLTFYSFEARPIFDFAGKVTITPPDEYEEFGVENLYLYTYEKDGSLKPVKQAKVGEDGDTLEFRTTQLGKYVLSSEQLTLLSDAERAALEALKEAEANGETVVEDAVVVEDNKANPSTGC